MRLGLVRRFKRRAVDHDDNVGGLQEMGNRSEALCVERGMTRALAATLAGVFTLVSLTACGSAEQAGRVPGTTSSASASPSASPSPSKLPPTTPPTLKGPNPMPVTPTGPPQDLPGPATKGGKYSTVRVKGTVSDGVEPGCTLLTSKGVVYLLLWGQNKTHFTGTEIEVEGTVKPDLMTTCQQGTPLVVHRILSS